MYWPVDWFYDFDGYELINEYVDTDPSWSAEQMARELTIHAAEKYLDNRRALDRLYNYESTALVLFGIEVLTLYASIS